jgi:hypothetical protein
MGLGEILMDDLQESAEYFARQLVAPEPLVEAYCINGGERSDFAYVFGIPESVAEDRWKDEVLRMI